MNELRQQQIVISIIFKMLVLEPVSKYQKQAASNFKKTKKSGVYESGPLGEQQQSKDVQQQSRDVQQQSKELSSVQGQDDELYGLSQIESDYWRKIKQCSNYSLRQFQDSQLTKFIHDQRMLIKWTMNLLAMSSIFLSLMRSMLSIQSINITISLALHSAITAALLTLVYLKYFTSVLLKEKQLIKTKMENAIFKCLKHTILEVLVILIHPNLLTQDLVIKIQQPVEGQSIPLQVNTFFQIFMLLRVYLMYAALIGSSLYCTTRANRICRIYSTKNEELFGLKSVFNANPLTTLVALFSTLVLIYSQMLKLSEETNTSFQSYGNAIWCVIITMGTIGYGDYAPTTYLGRLVAFLAAISGIIMASLLILTLSKYLTMSSKENKSHITLQRLEMRKLLEKYAEQTIIHTTSLTNLKDQGSDQAIQNLKQKTEKVKLTMRRIKNKIDGENINEEINRLFETLQESLMEIYLQQNRYAKQLQRLSKQQKQTIKESKFSFTNEIENIIKEE